MTVQEAKEAIVKYGLYEHYKKHKLYVVFDIAQNVETDEAKRAEMFTELQQLVAEEALFYPFGTNLRIFVTNPALQGMEDATFVPIYTFDDFSKLYFE